MEAQRLFTDALSEILIGGKNPLTAKQVSLKQKSVARFGRRVADLKHERIRRVRYKQMQLSITHVGYVYVCTCL